jgi:hypothetical protein
MERLEFPPHSAIYLLFLLVRRHFTFNRNSR